jgi:hypothetical protein
MKRIKRIRDNSGKYAVNPAKGILVAAKIHPTQHKALVSLVAQGETLSDKVREAIAFYLAHHPIDTTEK